MQKCDFHLLNCAVEQKTITNQQHPCYFMENRAATLVLVNVTLIFPPKVAIC